MTDMSAIAGAFGAFKAMKDIAETMVSLRDAQAFQEKRLEFQARIIDAQDSVLSVQQERAALIERIRQLEKQIADAETWETEKQRYELKKVAPGAFTYALKREASGSEPPHWICTTCYQNHKKSILQELVVQINPFPSGETTWACPVCSTKFRVPFEVSQ